MYTDQEIFAARVKFAEHGINEQQHYATVCPAKSKFGHIFKRADRKNEMILQIGAYNKWLLRLIDYDYNQHVIQDFYDVLYYKKYGIEPISKKRVPLSIDIKKYVLIRGNNECCVCSAKMGLQIHHKNSIPSDNRLSNLCVVCYVCHKNIHSQLSKLN